LWRRWNDAEIDFVTERSGPRGVPGSRANSRSCSTARTQDGVNCPRGYRRGSPWTDGQFSTLVTRLVAAVAEEPGTLAYEWSFQPDQKTYNVMEVYQNSDALAAHIKYMSGGFLNELAQVRKTTTSNCFWFARRASQGGVDPPRSFIHISD